MAADGSARSPFTLKTRATYLGALRAAVCCRAALATLLPKISPVNLSTCFCWFHTSFQGAFQLSFNKWFDCVSVCFAVCLCALPCVFGRGPVKQLMPALFYRRENGRRLSVTPLALNI